MKKYLMIVVMAIFTTSAFAQYVDYNVQLRLNMSNHMGTSESASPKMKLGLTGGVGASIHFGEMWSVDPSLLISMKGAKYNGVTETYTVNQNYLELPIMATVRFYIGEGTNLFIGAGPYFAYGIGGKSTVKAGSLEYKADTFKDASGTQSWNGLNRFDAGIGIRAGIELSRFVISMHGDFGLTRLNDSGFMKDVKNVDFGIGVAYRF